MTQTILVVEDEVKIRELLRSYLEREGFTVVTTPSGAEAILLAETAAPDLIVLDLRLPDIPGEEVAREVRRNSARLPRCSGRTSTTPASLSPSRPHRPSSTAIPGDSTRSRSTC